MTTKNFEIGQVVYVLAEQNQTILPGIVVEEIVVKKMTGNSVSWKIKVGAEGKAKLYDSSKINAEVYGNLDELRAGVIENFMSFVDNMCTDAQNRVEKWYGKEIAERQKQLSSLSASDVGERIDPDAMLSSLGEDNGNPQAQTTQPSGPSLPTNKSQLREKLERLVTDDAKVNTFPQEGQMFITGPNGERIPVKVNE